MYYPYLRGKQFELMALREFSQEKSCNHFICPIIEPVKSNLNALNNAIRVMKEQGLSFVLVLNPNDGDFKYTKSDLLVELEELREANWKPAFLYNRNIEQILNTITEKDLKNVCVIFKDGIDFNRDKELENFLCTDSIQNVVVANIDETRSAKTILKRLGKDIIRLDDKFHEQKRNADYLNNVEEIFTEEPFYYENDGFNGFADYLTLPKNYTDGGMLPYAIAIHFTYKPEQNSVYIHHFVSDTNFDQSNIQGKFAEAGRKVIKFFREHNDYFRSSAINTLEDYIQEGKYPGLGVLKKLSIKHHLLLISLILEK